MSFLNLIPVACSGFWLRLSPYLVVAALLAFAILILVRNLTRRSQGCSTCSSCSACAMSSCPSRRTNGNAPPAAVDNKGAPHGRKANPFTVE